MVFFSHIYAINMNKFLSSFSLRTDKLFRLSKCIREWKKVGRFGEKLSPCPDHGGIKKPLPKFARLPGKWLLHDVFRISFSPSQRASRFLTHPSILISRPLSSLLPRDTHFWRCTFLKLHSYPRTATLFA